jgi:hypothetical protein
MAAPVRIRVGASVDASVERTFASIEQRAIKAGANIRRALQVGPSMTSGPVKSQASAVDAVTKAYQQQAAAATAAAGAEVSGAKQATAAQQAYKNILQQTRLTQEQMDRIRSRARYQVAYERDLSDRRREDSFARRISYRATRFFMPEAPIGTMALRGLGSVARGLGVDTTLQSSFSRSAEHQRVATDLSNMGYLPNDPTGRNTQRVDPATMVEMGRDLQKRYGISTSDTLGGIEKYTAISGNLSGALAAMPGLAELSRGTGSNLTDMADAAGNVDAMLGDIPNKAQVVDDVMRSVAAYSKVGGVEIKDFATQMARVASAAAPFEGDMGENIKQMAILAQISRGKGGSPSSREAARAVVGFTNTLMTPARIAAFKDEGIDVYNEKGEMRDPYTLIKEALVATGGHPEKMNEMFKNVIGARTVAGLRNVFTKEGGGEAGLAAVDKLINVFASAGFQPGEIEENAKRASETDSAKAEKFNAAWDDMIDNVRGRLVPALEAHSESILDVAGVLTNLIASGAEHPGAALVGMGGFAIGRSGAEAALRAGIERAIMEKAGDPNAKMSKIAAISTGLTVASMAVTTFMVGTAIIDHWMVKTDKEDQERHRRTTETTNLGLEALAAEDAGEYEKAKQLRQQQLEASLRDIETTKEKTTPSLGDLFMENFTGLPSWMNDALGIETAKPGTAQEQAEMNKELLKSQLAEAVRAREALTRISELMEAGTQPVQGRVIDLDE